MNNETQDKQAAGAGQEPDQAAAKPEDSTVVDDAGAAEAEAIAAMDLGDEVEPESELTVEELLGRLEKAADEVADYRDQALRARADADNAIKRMEREADKARKFALERFAGELLAVVDSLEMGLQAADGETPTVEGLKEGTELTLKTLLAAVAKFGIESVEPSGKRFDPQVHEAMAMAPTPDAEPNTVINVIQKGYTLNGRLLRPARVVVATAPPAESAAE